MSDKPEINWRLPLEVVWDGDGQRYPRTAKLLYEHYRLPDGKTCKLVLLEDAYESRTALYHHDGTPVARAYPNWVLRNKMSKVTKWYNLYTNRPGHTYFDSEKEALDHVLAGNRIATLSVDIEVPCELDVPYPRPK